MGTFRRQIFAFALIMAVVACAPKSHEGKEVKVTGNQDATIAPESNQSGQMLATPQNPNAGNVAGETPETVTVSAVRAKEDAQDPAMPAVYKVKFLAAQVLTGDVLSTLTNAQKSPVKIAINYGCYAKAADLPNIDGYETRLNFLQASKVIIHQTTLNEDDKPMLEFTCQGAVDPKASALPILAETFAQPLKVGKSTTLTISSGRFAVNCAKDEIDASLNTTEGISLMPGAAVFTAIDTIADGPHQGAKWTLVSCQK